MSQARKRTVQQAGRDYEVRVIAEWNENPDWNRLARLLLQQLREESENSSHNDTDD